MNRHSLQRLVLFLALLAAGALWSDIAQAERRVALVIGNGAYVHTRALPNALNDALALDAFLKGIGFDVMLRENLGYKEFREAIREFGRVAAGADIAVVYYAGHGLELAGNNYLVPVDARLLNSGDLEYEAITLGSVLDGIRAKRMLNLIILDACRNNPLADKMALLNNTRRSVQRGLARIEPKGDVLVAFAANAGSVAEDGSVGAGNSPYAEALIRYLGAPGVDVRLALGGVRDAVLAATNHGQEPVIFGSLGGRVIPLVPGQPGSQASVPVREQEARSAWEVVKDTCSAGELELFLTRYKDTFYGDLASRRLKDIEILAACAGARGARTEDVLIRRIQAELHRAGCLGRQPDGVWAAQSASALQAFARYAGLGYSPSEPTQDALDDLERTKGRVCPLQCAAGETAKGDRCEKVERAAVPPPRPALPATEAAPPARQVTAPAMNGSCESARSACAQLRSQCLKTCREKFGNRTYGDCNNCLTSYPFCVSQAAGGACQ